MSYQRQQPEVPPATPPTPRQKKVQEALNLFAQLQSAPFLVGDDEQRVRHAADLHKQNAAEGNTNSGTATRSSSTPPPPTNMLKKGSGTGGGAAPSLMTTKQLHQQIADLQKKLQMSDAIMKKLHKKNKELKNEIDVLQTGGGGDAASGRQQQQQATAAAAATKSDSPAAMAKGSPIGGSGGNGGLTNEQLKAIIIKRDQEIMALRKQLILQQQGGGGTMDPTVTATQANSAATADGAPPSPSSTSNSPSSISHQQNAAAASSSASASPARPGTNTKTNNNNNAILHTPNTKIITIPTNVPIEAHVALLHKRIDTLQKDYQQLLDSKLDAIAAGESTGKVNKQVKIFFAAVKAKISSDMSEYEAERALWHQRLALVANQQQQRGGGGPSQK